MYIPLLALDGSLYGHEERNVEGSKKPYTSVSSAPVGSWLVHGKDAVVLVEDAFSQARVWQGGITCCRLSGTEVYDTESVRLFNDVVVCLDKDASHKAVRIARQLGNARVVLLDRDIKDMSVEEFEELRAVWKF